MMEPIFRRTGSEDIEATYVVRAATRENPISRSRLIELGFTPSFVGAQFLVGAYLGWVCEDAGTVVAFCTGDGTTGEILALAVLPNFEGRKIGIRLLNLVVRDLRTKGGSRVWLSASADPRIRAHGFYRANGWVPTGEVLDNGDEVLVYPLPPRAAVADGS